MSSQAYITKRKFSFLCGNFLNRNFIYAVKDAEHPWHYFELQDSLSSSHCSLPTLLDSLISTLNEIKTVEVPLDENEWINYYDKGKFIFKNRELKTYMHIAKGESENGASKANSFKTTDQLIFISGQSNPLLFLNEYEKCRDLKNDRDKMFKIRNFVDVSHRAEFNQLNFISDWPTVRQVFIKKYASSFTQNQKRELNIDFQENSTLRSFVELKLEALSSYTTLPFLNQMEIVLADLSCSISKLFLINEKLTSSKTEILDFCDAIQDLVLSICDSTDKSEKDLPEIQNPLNSLEVFTYDSELQSESDSMSIIAHSSSRRVNTGTRKKPVSKKVIIDTSELDDSSQSSISSSNTMSVDYSPNAVRNKGERSTKNTVKKPRGRPRKNLFTIPEENTDSAAESLSERSDASSTTSNRFKPY